MSWLDPKALIEAWQEVPQDLVCLVDGGGTSQSKLGDQAVLEGAPGALDAALGLRSVGEDEADAQLLQCPAELSGVTPAP